MEANLQYCSGFCHTLIWISHGFTCVPHLEPPSHFPPHPIPLGHPSALALSTLSHALNLDRRSVSHMVIYMFQCYSLKSSHPQFDAWFWVVSQLWSWLRCVPIKHRIPRWLSGKESACQCRRHRRWGFKPWVGKNPWRRKWQHVPVSMPGKSQGQRRLQSMGLQRVGHNWAYTHAKCGHSPPPACACLCATCVTVGNWCRAAIW